MKFDGADAQINHSQFWHKKILKARLTSVEGFEKLNLVSGVSQGKH